MSPSMWTSKEGLRRQLLQKRVLTSMGHPGVLLRALLDILTRPVRSVGAPVREDDILQQNPSSRLDGPVAGAHLSLYSSPARDRTWDL